MTFENTIRWCIEDGAPLTCTRSETENQLLLAETPHKLHRRGLPRWIGLIRDGPRNEPTPSYARDLTRPAG